MPRDFTIVEEVLPSGLEALIDSPNDCPPQEIFCDLYGNRKNENEATHYLMQTGKNAFELWKIGRTIKTYSFDCADSFPHLVNIRINDKLVGTYHRNYH